MPWILQGHIHFWDWFPASSASSYRFAPLVRQTGRPVPMNLYKKKEREMKEKEKGKSWMQEELISSCWGKIKVCRNQLRKLVQCRLVFVSKIQSTGSCDIKNCEFREDQKTVDMQFVHSELSWRKKSAFPVELPLIKSFSSSFWHSVRATFPRMYLYIFRGVYLL